MCSWWALRSPGCVRVLSWWTLKQRMSLLHSLSRGTITNTLFPGERRKHCTAHRLFLQVNGRVSLLHLCSWQQDVSSKTRYQVAPDQSDSPKSLVLSLTGCSNKGPFSSMSVSQTTQVSTPFFSCRAKIYTDRWSQWWLGTILRLLPTFVSPTIRLQADRGAWFSHCVKRLCQIRSPSKCTGGPSWSQSSPINDGPISSSCDLWAGKWKAWRCSHLYNQCQGASDMDTPSLPTPHQPLWSDGDA